MAEASSSSNLNAEVFKPAAAPAGSAPFVSTTALPGMEAEQQQEDDSRPESPLNMTGMKELLRKPFSDVLKLAAAGLQMKANAHLATEQLRFCLHNDPSYAPELLSSSVVTPLAALVKESPGLPVAGSAMAIFAVAALLPDGRARLRAEGVVPPVMRFLSMPGVLQRPNAEHALLLLQNMSCDKHCRQAIVKSEGLILLLNMLKQYGGWMRQHPGLAGTIAGILTHIVVGDGEGSSSSSSGLTPKQKFVMAGGIETVCKAIAEWGRTEPPPYILRLRLLLHEVSHNPQYTTRVQDVALDAGSLSARLGPLAGGQRSTPRPAAVDGALSSQSVLVTRLGETSGDALDVGDYVDRLGHGIILGTPRMPALRRIADAVLASKSMADTGDATPQNDEGALAEPH